MTKVAHCYTDKGEYSGTCAIEANEWTGEYKFPELSTEKEPTFEGGKTPYFKNGEWVNQ